MQKLTKLGVSQKRSYGSNVLYGENLFLFDDAINQAVMDFAQVRRLDLFVVHVIPLVAALELLYSILAVSTNPIVYVLYIFRALRVKLEAAPLANDNLLLVLEGNIRHFLIGLVVFSSVLENLLPNRLHRDKMAVLLV